MAWDGKERRNGMQDNPEILKTLNSMDKNIALLTQSSQAQVETFKAHVINFQNHLVEDNHTNKEISEKISNTDIKMAFYAGGLAVIALILKFVFKV